MKKFQRYPGIDFNSPCIVAALLGMVIFLTATEVKAAGTGVVTTTEVTGATSTEVGTTPGRAAVTSTEVGKTPGQAAVTSAEVAAMSAGAATISDEVSEVMAKSGGSSPWSLETSLTFHIVNIYMLKATYRYSDRVELSIGPAYQNWKNEDQSFIGQAHAYTLVMSYRYYFWRKFNVELELWPAWNNFKSFIDNNTYRGLELWVEYKLGYRVDLGRRFHINVQPGIGHPVWLQNKWPGVEYDNQLKFMLDGLIFVPQVLLGYRF